MIFTNKKKINKIKYTNYKIKKLILFKFVNKIKGKNMEIEQEKFNISMRKFLKKVGITSQQKIEEAVKSEIERKKALNNNIKVSLKLEIKEINLVHFIDGEICLKDN